LCEKIKKSSSKDARSNCKKGSSGAEGGGGERERERKRKNKCGHGGEGICRHAYPEIVHGFWMALFCTQLEILEGLFVALLYSLK
jgi:hypothetical protein